MPVDILDLVKDAQNRALATIEQVNDTAVTAVRSGFGFVEGALPDLSWLPGIEALPQPKALVDNGFDFASKVLKTQRAFANDLLKAANPVIKAVYGPASRNGSAKTAA